MSAYLDPLVAAAPAEVPLKNAPLVRVIAQLRFPEILSVEQRDFVAPFQEAIRRKYPILHQEQAQGIIFAQAGVMPARPQIAWRFSDTGGHWRVSLTPQFVAVETTKYHSRADFLERLREVATALEEHVAPARIDRFGIRYIDRITGAAVDDIATLVHPEVRGIVGTIASTHATHAICESMFALPEERVLVRWGSLAAGTTLDMAAMEPIDEKSWILDIDMSSAGPKPFAVDEIVADAHRYAERIYTIFRWAVTPAFLARFGGQT